jgi:pimeloyl-ACP methyl ester carboxylesterase
MRATASHETVMFLPSLDSTVMAVVTLPTGASLRTGIVVLAGAPYGTSAQRNQWATRLCRHFAGQGFTTVRLDWHGTGESSGTGVNDRSINPYVSDALAAIDLLSPRELDSVLVIGRCLGGWAGLIAGSRREQVRGVALLLPTTTLNGREDRRQPVWTWPGITARLTGRPSPRRPAPLDRNFMEPLATLADRDAHVLLLHAAGSPGLQDFQAAARRQGRVLSRGGVDHHVIPVREGRLLEHLDRQADVAGRLETWVKTVQRSSSVP